MDLYLTQRQIQHNVQINMEWVKGHSEKKDWKMIQDLEDQQLTRDRIYNVWCDRRAETQWKTGSPSFHDPEVTSAERWAIYATSPHYHKLIGKLDEGFYSAIRYSDMASFIQRKHNLSEAKLLRIHLLALHGHFAKLKPFQRPSVSKMIHGWIPTYGTLCRQGRESSPLCPRCNSTVETCDHIFNCPHPLAIESHHVALHTFLSSLVTIGTPLYIISTFEYKLSNVLHLAFNQKYSITFSIPQYTKNCLMEAIKHQNILGWDNFLRGFTSIYWTDLVLLAHHDDKELKPHQLWAEKLVSFILSCTQSIWQSRNKSIHGTSRLEAKQLLCQRVVDQVIKVYNKPPLLHQRFQNISKIPLQQRLTRSTTNLQRWLSRITHQSKVSAIMKQQSPHRQLSLKHAYRRSNISIPDSRKFPP